MHRVYTPDKQCTLIPTAWYSCLSTVLFFYFSGNYKLLFPVQKNFCEWQHFRDCTNISDSDGLSSAPFVLQIIKNPGLLREGMWRQYADASIIWEEIPHVIRKNCIQCTVRPWVFFHGVCERKTLQTTSNLSHWSWHIKHMQGQTVENSGRPVYFTALI